MRSKLQTWIPHLIILFGWVVLWLVIAWNIPGDDLSSSYIASRIIAENINDHLYVLHPTTYHLVDDPVWIQTAKENGVNAFLHPYVQIPLWAWIIQPLAINFSYMTFNRIFLCLNLFSMYGILAISSALWYPILLTPRRLLISLLLLSITTPFIYTIYLNQTQPIILFFVLFAIYLEKTNKVISSGWSLAIAAIIKITPGVIAIYWLFTGRIKNSIVFIFSMILLFITTIICVGLSRTMDFFVIFRKISDITMVSYNNQSILASIMSIKTDPKEILDWTMFYITPISKVINYSIMGIGIIAIILLKQRIKSHSWENIADGMGIVSIMIITTILSAIAWTHYYIILLMPIFILLEWSRRRNNYWMLIPIIVIYCLNIYPFAINPLAPQLFSWINIRSHLISACIALICLIYCLIQIVRLQNKVDEIKASK